MSITDINLQAGAVPIESAQQVFDRLLRPQLRRLHRLAFRLTGNRPDAEDLLQDVLTRIFERANELSSIEDLRPWSNRVLYNRYIDLRRRSHRRRFALVGPRPVAAFGTDVPSDDISQLVSPQPGPEAAALLSSDMACLDEALRRLSDEHRAVVLLHDAEGNSLEEIAAMIGVPVGTVKSRLHRARARLRGFFSEGTFQT